MSAHHSFDAEYDSKRPITVTGYVTKLDWLNPHAYVFLDAKNDGQTMNYRIEMGPPYAPLAGSYPTTDQLHLAERISRRNLKTLIYEATIDDPGAYTAWTVRWQINETTASSWVEGGELFEYICQDDRDD